MNSECSQKLLQWKKDENKRKKRAKKQQQRNVTIPRIVITNEKAIAIEKCAPRKKYLFAFYYGKQCDSSTLDFESRAV